MPKIGLYLATGAAVCAVHAVEFGDSVLDLGGAVRADVAFKFENLAHGSSFRSVGRLAGTAVCYSQIWLMPWASTVYTWSSASE